MARTRDDLFAGEIRVTRREYGIHDGPNITMHIY